MKLADRIVATPDTCSIRIFPTWHPEAVGRVLRLTIGNCSTTVLLRWLDRHWRRVEAELASDGLIVTV